MPMPDAAALLGAAALLILAGSGQAQTPAPAPLQALAMQGLAPESRSQPGMGFVQALREAARTHPAVRNADQLRLQAGEGVKAARSGYLPQVRLGVDTQRTSYDRDSYASRNVYTAKLTASQMLYDFGKVSGEVKKARAAVRAGEAQVELSVDEVITTTAQAWVDAHLYRVLAGIAREQLEAMRAVEALVAKRVRLGATPRSDLEQARSRVDAARSLLLGAEADEMRASLNLMHLTGREAPVEIAGGLPVGLHDACLSESAGVSSPSVRLADARRDEARADLGSARAARLPTLSLDGTFDHALTKDSRLYGEYENTSAVGLNFSVPLFEGGGGRARERAAHYQLNAADEAAAQARLEMRRGFSEAQAQADGWARRAPVLQARVDSIDTTRDLYQEQYLHLGTRSLLDVLNAEQEFHNARIEQAQGEHQQYRFAVMCLYYGDRLRSAFDLDRTADESGGAAL